MIIYVNLSITESSIDIISFEFKVMQGYFKNNEATINTLKNEWLHSGDIAYYDETGRFYIVDRLKELIKVKGFQVPPAEPREHAQGRDAKVVGALAGEEHLGVALLVGDVRRAHVADVVIEDMADLPPLVAAFAAGGVEQAKGCATAGPRWLA